MCGNCALYKLLKHQSWNANMINVVVSMICNILFELYIFEFLLLNKGKLKNMTFVDAVLCKA